MCVCGVFSRRPFVRAAPRRFLHTPGCGASEMAKPGPPCPSPRAALGLQQWAGGRGRRKRLPEALSPSPAGRPRRAAWPRDRRPPITAPARPLPRPPPRLARGWAGPHPPPRSGRSLGVRPPQPGRSGGGRGREGGGSLAEPLPGGRAAQAQTFPFVVAPRAGAAPGVVMGGGR